MEEEALQLTLFETKSVTRQKDKHFASKEKILGQFLTPYEIAKFIVDFVSLSSPKKLSVDPACGDGTFLSALIEAGYQKVVGIDIDEHITRTIPANVKKNAEIIIQNGLKKLPQIDGRADVVVGNPPFSAKYGRINDKALLKHYDLGKGRETQAVEILFLERFLQIVSLGGFIGVILPFGIFANLPLAYVRQFIIKNASVLGIISLPRYIFSGKRGTSSKTCILFAQKKPAEKQTVFMGTAERTEDLSVLLDLYRKGKSSEKAIWTHLEVEKFYPEAYLWRKVSLERLGKTRWTITTLGGIVAEMFCGQTEYGVKRQFADSGIPFISAKTITELGLDFDRDRKYIQPGSAMDKRRAYVKVGDVLFVRVGVGCIGRTSVVTRPEEIGIADDWIYIIRTRESVNPFYLAFYLQSEYAKEQINTLKRGVGTVTIPQTLLKDVAVPLPPKDIQERFEEIYLKMVEYRKVGVYNSAQTELDKAFKYLDAILKNQC